MLVVVLSALALIVVDQRSVADALPLTQTSDADPSRVYEHFGTGVRIQSESLYGNPRNTQEPHPIQNAKCS